MLVEPQLFPKVECHDSDETHERYMAASESVVRAHSYHEDSPCPRLTNEPQLYAKICSDYLVGQAESIEQLVRTITGLSTRTNLVIGAQDSHELAYASRALEQAQRELEDAFGQFESDSTAFVHFLRNGDDWDGEGASQMAAFDGQASEIMAAVAAARRAVAGACKVVSSLEYESLSLSEVLDSMTVSGSSVLSRETV